MIGMIITAAIAMAGDPQQRFDQYLNTLASGAQAAETAVQCGFRSPDWDERVRNTFIQRATIYASMLTHQPAGPRTLSRIYVTIETGSNRGYRPSPADCLRLSNRTLLLSQLDQAAQAGGTGD
jgi:hypothetical protein